MWAQVKVWSATGQSEDYVKAALGLKGLKESALKTHPNYKYLEKFRYKAEGRMLDVWFEDGYSTQSIWEYYKLENIPEAQLATNAGFKIYYRYAKMYDSAIFNHKNSIFEPPIYYGGTPRELNVKVRIWAEKHRPRWYVEEMLEIDSATRKNNPYFQKFLELRGSVQQMYLDRIVTFMSNNRRAFWMICHWFVIHDQPDAYSLGLHSERKNECDKARLLYQVLLDEAVNAVNAGLPQSMLEEPGVWTFPSKCCTWIWMADSHTKSDSAPYTLQEQLELVGQEDPARTQWNTCASDDVCIAHLPAHVRSLKHRSAADCRCYLVSSKFP
ncbi:RxLR effector protein [Phytophthora cinnamomi]|uniref:RxLR effector protein n=1 Tax=Phytophthora cinnamomi TaxID=4785 RepID=UPI00355AB33F|nr:RxLR effector protein [Phytophthora cinnamomi]